MIKWGMNKMSKFFKISQILIITTFLLFSMILASSIMILAEVKLEHQGKVEISDTSPTVGDEITISGKIMNIGNKTSDTLVYNIELFWDYNKDGTPDNNEGYYIENNYTEYRSIEPNDTYDYEFDWKAGNTEEPKEEKLTGNFVIRIAVSYEVEQEDNNETKVVNIFDYSVPFTIKEKEKGLCIMGWVALIPICCIIFKKSYKNSE